MKKQTWQDVINAYPDNDAVSIYSDEWAEQCGIDPMKYPQIYSDEYLLSLGVNPETYRVIKQWIEKH